MQAFTPLALVFRPWLKKSLTLGNAQTSLALLSLTRDFDTRRVSDNERRSWISLSLADSLQGLRLVGTHSNLSHIDIAVCGSNHTEVFLAHALTSGSKLSDSTDRSSLRCLTAGVRSLVQVRV